MHCAFNRANVPKRAYYIIIAITFLLFLTSSSSISIQTVVPQFSALTFYVTPLEDSSSKANLSVSYNDSTIAVQIMIYSFSFVLSKQKKMYSIWNYEASSQNILINITSSVQLAPNMVKIDTPKSIPVFLAAFDKTTSSGYMLPFNMLNLKTLKIYVIAVDQPVQKITYNLEPYMSTYWTEKQSSIQLMPHLPYFSQCSIEKSFILINDVLEPNKCGLKDYFGFYCEDKRLDFQCILQELEVSNVDSQFWFNNDLGILYYLFPTKKSLPQLYQANKALQGKNALALTLFDNLVPVYYIRNSQHSIIVNNFYICIKVAFTQDQTQKHIVYAEILGRYDANLPSPYANVHVIVKYLNIFQRFNSFDLPWIWYMAYAITMGTLLGLCICLIMNRTSVKRMKENIRHILAPAVKGCLYTAATGGCFFIFINQISYQTDFSTVSANYGDDLTDERLQMNNIGRNGLAVALTGLYLMTAGLKQACKVHSAQELKIVFEDDSRLEQRGAMSEQQLAERIEFAKKNMVSHQKSILLCNILLVAVGILYASFILSLQNLDAALELAFVVPFLTKILNELIKHVIIKELLYTSGNLLSLILTSTLIMLRGRTVAQFTYLYFSRFLNLYIELILIQICYAKLLAKLEANQDANKLTKLLSKWLQSALQFKRNQSAYERAIYIGSLIAMQVVGVILIPLVALVIYLLGRTTLLQSGLLMGTKSSGYSLLMLVSLVPMELLAIFALLQVMKRSGVRVQEVIKFNRFRFRRRKFRWMNDQFSLSRNIQLFYRQYQKFAFSSQLYFVVSLLGFSGFLIYMGVLVVLQSSYMLANDPIVLILMLAVMVAGDVLSFVLSLVALKMRLYEKKEEEVMRQNLLKTDKYLRNSDITDFLPLEGVKDYFLHYNSEWIVHNLPKIFDKEDFEENAGELIAKYKHYKSLFKKKQIDERRIKRLKQNSVLASTAHLPSQPQLALPRRAFKLATPIVYYWLYLARQSLYLKSIVASVRRDKIKKNCEFCNMDVQLQALQRRDFLQLVNQFRLLNVNRVFDKRNFLEFYRLRQKYVTICVECKEKNLHMENKITMKENASKMVKRWHLITKSYILHHREQKT